ncbi:hypothetical protein MMC29_000510 [Sticta canariensis]|nr:hypothetical protein [Sticta canariensis]
MSNHRKTIQSNQLKISKGSSQAASLAASLGAALPTTVSSCNPSVAITTLSAVDTTVFEIQEDTADAVRRSDPDITDNPADCLPVVVEEQHPHQKPDFRFADLQSNHDKASIQIALFYTREDCRVRLGVKTMGIRTTPGKCYASQRQEIQRRFTELGLLRGDVEAPVLVQMEACTRNFNN